MTDFIAVATAENSKSPINDAPLQRLVKLSEDNSREVMLDSFGEDLKLAIAKGKPEEAPDLLKAWFGRLTSAFSDKFSDYDQLFGLGGDIIRLAYKNPPANPDGKTPDPLHEKIVEVVKQHIGPQGSNVNIYLVDYAWELLTAIDLHSGQKPIRHDVFTHYTPAIKPEERRGYMENLKIGNMFMPDLDPAAGATFARLIEAKIAKREKSPKKARKAKENGHLQPTVIEAASSPPAPEIVSALPAPQPAAAPPSLALMIMPKPLDLAEFGVSSHESVPFRPVTGKPNGNVSSLTARERELVDHYTSTSPWAHKYTL